ncbi:MAG: energy transducer TonB [Candidatus Eisenbacteria bacterium]
MKAKPLVFDDVRLEAEGGRRRTRWSMGVSTVAHVVALFLLTAARPAERAGDDLLEVTLLDGGGAPAEAAAPAAAPRSAETSVGAPQPRPTEERFQRELRRADLAPTPQSDLSVADQISSRLSALRQSSAPASAGSQLGAAPNLLASPAGMAAGGAIGAPVALHRGGGTGGSGITLGRGGSGPSALASVAPAPAAPVAAAEAPREEGAARRAAGADLMGPIADRRILRQVTPVFPEWAKRDGVEGSVTLYFVVRADGTVKENILIQKTAGFGDFDENARAALREWRFEPLRRGEAGEQWGTITLNFRLRGQ